MKKSDTKMIIAAYIFVVLIALCSGWEVSNNRAAREKHQAISQFE